MKKETSKGIDDYLEEYEGVVRSMLEDIRKIIASEAPDAREKISYRMPTFDLHGNLVHFAAQAHHLGFYPTPSAIEKFKTELAPYRFSKGAVQFPYDSQLPEDLIRRMVRFRVEENESIAREKGN
jgi:uncharacterized protein YdhG (YjbR/CyaY superfamily)